jgi:hypothetical protein
VSLFRRREPLHVRLAREGGMSLGDEPVRPAWDATGIHGLHRAREWDVVTTLESPELSGERVTFVALPGGDLLVEHGAKDAPGNRPDEGLDDGLDEGPESIRSFAEAVERELEPPYRAEAVKRDDGLWAVGARRIEVVELPGVRADEIELTMRNGERTLLVDGETAFGSIPALERPGHAVRASRLDGERWEFEAHPL